MKALVKSLVGCALLSSAALAQATATPRTLTLAEAEEAARAHQPTLRQARAGTQAALARADEARSGLYPQVFAQLGYQRTTYNTINRAGGGNIPVAAHSDFATDNAFSGAITANQLIYDFGQTTGRYHAQEANAAATAQTERATTLNVVLNVRAAFFSARANKALAGVARDSLENLKKHESQIDEMVKNGIRAEIDLLQARTDLANGQVTLINAENAYETSKASLNQAMGVPGPTDYDVADEQLKPIDGEDGSVEALYEEAKKARPEIASLEESQRAQRETIRSVEGAYGPTIGAQAGLTQGGTALDHLNWNGSVGVSLSWNIYQGGLTNATVREAEENLRSISAQLETLEQQIRFEVEQDRLALRAAKGTVSAGREVLTNARGRLQLAEQRYQQGLGSIIELSDAQVAVTQAAAQLVQADFNLSAARAQLLKALGRP